VIRGGSGRDALHGDAGIDQLYGDSGDDNLFGDAGDDQGSQAGQRLYGGAGRDNLYAYAPTNDVTVESTLQGDQLFGGSGGDFLFGNIRKELLVGDEGNDFISGDALRGKRYLDNAWFVGFAPRQDPDIVVSVLVQGGREGAEAAAPIARDIIRAYYQKKNQKQQQYTKATKPPVVETAQAAVNP